MKRTHKLLALALALLLSAVFVTGCKKTPDPEKDPTKIKITFNLNYGDKAPAGEPPEPIYVTIGGKYPKLPSPTRTGYSFGGWYSSTQTVPRNLISEGDEVFDDQDLTLFAKWTGNVYRVTFEFGATGELNLGVPSAEITEEQALNGSSKGPDGEIYKNVEFGIAYGKAPNVRDIREGYVFLYWYLLESGKEVRLDTGSDNISSDVATAENHKVYAKFGIAKNVWDFTDAADTMYFSHIGGNAYALYADGTEGMDLPLVFDENIPALKITNAPGAAESWFEFSGIPTVQSGSRVTIEVSVSLAGPMTDDIFLRIDYRTPGNIYGSSKSVKPVSGAWPTANGGRQTFTLLTTRNASGFFFIVSTLKASANQMKNSQIFLHSVRIDPPVEKAGQIWDFTAATDSLFFPKLNGPVFVGIDGQEKLNLEYDSSVPAMKIANTSAEKEVWFEFSTTVKAGSTVTAEFMISLPGTMHENITLRIDRRDPKKHPGVTRDVSPAGGKWPTANGGKQTLSYTTDVNCGGFFFIITAAWGSNQSALEGAVYYLTRIEIEEFDVAGAKTLWNFSSAGDAAYINYVGADAYTDGINKAVPDRAPGSAPLTWDSSKQAMKIVNAVGAEEIWFEFMNTILEGTTVTVEFSASYANMYGGVSFRVDTRQPNAYLANKVVSPAGGAWPGLQSFTFTADKGSSGFFFIFVADWGKANLTANAVGAEFYLHSITLTLPF